MSERTEPTAAHKPYVPDDVSMPEFTWQALVVGAVLGIVFGASSLYLVLKAGLTVSASIPVAVLAVTLFRALSQVFGVRKATILENNIVQTTGSAGESIAFGVGVTMPALMLLGFDMDLERVMVVALLGGVLGILMMIPLRRAFIVRLHGKAGEPGKLLYPEGTACAQVLISGEKGGGGGMVVFVGFGIAFLHKFVSAGMGLLKEAVEFPLKFFNRAAAVQSDLHPELLGVGYIIGLRTAGIMMAGGVLGYLVIAPSIALFGDGMTEPLPPGSKPIRQMEIKELRSNYILYIGAGCVATAGIISMFRTIPLIGRSIRSGFASLRAPTPAAALDERARRAADAAEALLSALPTKSSPSLPASPRAPPPPAAPAPAAPVGPIPRSEDDMSLKIVFIGSLLLVTGLAAFLSREVDWRGALLGAGLVVLFGFLFVTVSSRLTGEIGSSSNPISGMTVATLALTCLLFLIFQMTSPIDRVLALSIGAVVCIAASNGGTTSQDLKTGFLVGGRPRYMQWAIIVGAVTSALVIGWTLMFFNQAGTVYSTNVKNLPVAKGPEKIREGDSVRERVRPLPLECKWDDQWRLVGVRDGRLWRCTQTETYEGKEYAVLRPDKAEFDNVGPGKYLVDKDGKIAFYVDPAIGGKLTERDDGSKVNLKFEAPKTQVMALIINGVLGGELNWALVLMGAAIAVTLELCGVSSLAFAVGVYVPMGVSVPIFIGGLLRAGLDRWSRMGAAGDDEAAAIVRSETSPGVLLSSGYIAGGTLAGVAVAFLEFAPAFKNSINFSAFFTAVGRPGDSFAVGAFASLVLVLVLTGAGKLLAPRNEPAFPVTPK